MSELVLTPTRALISSWLAALQLAVVTWVLFVRHASRGLRGPKVVARAAAQKVLGENGEVLAFRFGGCLTPTCRRLLL